MSEHNKRVASQTGACEPNEHARRRSERLSALIGAEIERNEAPLSFARYMELALYAPGLGYYSAGAEQLGARGDFVTAPEISPLFGRCAARQIAELLAPLEGQGCVLEAGAGTGSLAACVLSTLDEIGELPSRYCILERSAGLKARQRARLGELAPRLAACVEWVDDFPAQGFSGVVIANELLDALPAHRLQRRDGAIGEWCVGWQDGAFGWSLQPCRDAALVGQYERLERTLGQPFPPGYTVELAPLRAAWVDEMGSRVLRGALLLFDYGYVRREFYHPQREAGTLTCHYRHRRHGDPLILTGLQDISAHVEFTALAEAGRAAGLDVAGLTTQAGFLLASGALDDIARLEPGSRAHRRLTQQIKRLVLPGEMGELVKAMALTRDADTPLLGFSHIDLRGRL